VSACDHLRNNDRASFHSEGHPALHVGRLGIEIEHVLHPGDVFSVDLWNAPQIVFGQAPAHGFQRDALVCGEPGQFTGQKPQGPTRAPGGRARTGRRRCFWRPPHRWRRDPPWARLSLRAPRLPPLSSAVSWSRSHWSSSSDSVHSSAPPLVEHGPATESDGQIESPGKNLHAEAGPVSGVYPPLYAPFPTFGYIVA
jgi:hypothetical protein